MFRKKEQEKREAGYKLVIIGTLIGMSAAVFQFCLTVLNNRELPPLTMEGVITTPETSPDELRLDYDSHPYKIFPVANTSYAFLLFYKKTGIMDAMESHTEQVGYLFNIETGTCDMQILFPRRGKHTPDHGYLNRFVDFVSVLSESGKPAILIHRNENGPDDRPDRPLLYSALESIFTSFKNIRGEEYWLLDLEGNLKRLKSEKNLRAYPSFHDSRRIIFSHGKTVYLMRYDDEELITEMEWETHDFITEITRLDEGLYCAKHGNAEGVTLLLDDRKPVVRYLSRGEIEQVLPYRTFEDLPLSLPEDIYQNQLDIGKRIAANKFAIDTFEPPSREDILKGYKKKAQNELDHHYRYLLMYPLSSNHHTEDPLVYLNAPGMPIFEIRRDQVRSGDVHDLFHYVGNCEIQKPVVAFENNRYLTFDHSSMFSLPRYQSEQETRESLHHTLTVYENRPNWGFGETINVDISIPQRDSYSSQFYSNIPIHDEYFLVFKDYYLYTMRWDGTERKQVFPKPEEE